MAREDILVKPVISEKSFAGAESGKYFFWVDSKVNKLQVKEAVEKGFKVEVTDVNILVQKGKVKTFGRKRKEGKRSDKKKAIVTLKKGQEIKDFAK
ncbi:MAG: 50S ribosomal protein L23 [Patescibacteria group bacterium]|nr:50S ribosomal protein L23 [Patescibacteria group bacterium]MCL5093981.1 50S ribosomal protein L23 [Patescibacteria group bacterium]